MEPTYKSTEKNNKPRFLRPKKACSKFKDGRECQCDRLRQDLPGTVRSGNSNVQNLQSYNQQNVFYQYNPYRNQMIDRPSAAVYRSRDSVPSYGYAQRKLRLYDTLPLDRPGRGDERY